jgi:sulfatase modifying factor 1
MVTIDGGERRVALTALSAPRARKPKNMVWIPAGMFLMGSEEFYPEEKPVRRREVEGFWMDVHPVTNAEFRRFVKGTGYVTTAESAPDADDYPEATGEQLVPGSLVFTPPDHPVSLHDFRAWWSWVPGAQWRHPEGPGSTSAGRDLHPVTHVSYDDAVAYALWAGKGLPTETEWERAARGGLDGARYAWGDQVTVKGRIMANTWHGQFPHENLRLDGYERTSPVGKFPPNGYGLVDVCGNVWEWTSDDYPSDHRGTARIAQEAHACCGPAGRRRLDVATSASGQQAGRLTSKVTKGGSHLCAPNYCLRYRPAARQAQTTDSSTSHLGFRCVLRTPP